MAPRRRVCFAGGSIRCSQPRCTPGKPGNGTPIPSSWCLESAVDVGVPLSGVTSAFPADTFTDIRPVLRPVVESPDLLPGDRVIDLAFLLRSSAVVGGFLAAGLSAWLLGTGIGWIAAAAFAAAAGGFLIGSLVRHLHFPVFAGLVTVVKLGPGAFPPALRSALAGSVSTAMPAAVLPALVFPGSADFPGLLLTGIIIGVVVGGVFAFLASRS